MKTKQFFTKTSFTAKVVLSAIVAAITFLAPNTAEAQERCTLTEFKALLNSTPKAIIQTYYSDGELFSETFCPPATISANAIDFSTVDSWEVVKGDQFKKLYPNSKFDVLIKFILKETISKTKPRFKNDDFAVKIYDHNGKLIKDVKFSELSSIPSDEIESMEIDKTKGVMTVVLSKPKQKKSKK